MTLQEKIRQKVLKFLGLEALAQNPNSDRFTYINNDEAIKKQKLHEYRVWYLGDSDELLNYYTHETTFGFAENPIYNRNKANYFWAIASQEGAIKRTHSGVPKAIIQTLSNAIGTPIIASASWCNETLKTILSENDFFHLLTQQQRPLTMVDGWGAYKIIIDKSISDYPLLQYYDAENVDYIDKCNKIIGIVYRDYYKKGNKNYVLCETRRVANGNSYIEYNLYQLSESDDVIEVPVNTLDELANCKNIEIKNFNKILGVPTKYLFNTLNVEYGASFYEGMIDKFDDLDQLLSQISQLVRVSTPVEYYNPDVLERDSQGHIKMPKVFNRQYIAKTGYPTGDGESGSNDIQTTQPNLQFSELINEYNSLVDSILIGVLSPASMGIDIAKKDNADAQREKEKITIYTRNNVIERETAFIKRLCELLLVAYSIMQNGTFDGNTDEFGVMIKYDEFANPSFDSQLQVLGNAYSNGQISTKRYVELLWNDKLTNEEKEQEIEYLEQHSQEDMLGGAYAMEQNNGEGNNTSDLPQEETNNINTANVEE